METAEEYRHLIMANGAYPQSDRLKRIIARAETIIACDGAANTLHRENIPITAVVGDLDSLSASVAQAYGDRLYRDTDQETNDLTKALSFARRLGITKLLILGATGCREDHALGNISLLAHHAPHFDRIEMASDYGIFTPLLRSATLGSYKGQTVSVFSLTPHLPVSTTGLRYPIHHRQLTEWWQGTLNQALGNTFALTLSADARVVVYRAFD